MTLFHSCGLTKYGLRQGPASANGIFVDKLLVFSFGSFYKNRDVLSASCYPQSPILAQSGVERTSRGASLR